MRPKDYEDLYSLEDNFWWFTGMREVTAALLDPFCSPARDRLVLDAGCGTGGMFSWLLRYGGGGKVIGIELVSDAINFCRARDPRYLIQASVTDLPFPDSVFDLVTSFDVLVQLPGEESDLRALREMHRVLRPGGIAFVRAAAYQWMRSGHDDVIGTQRRYSLYELIDKMESAGLRTLRASYANSFLLPVAMVHRLLLKRIGLSDRGSDVKPLTNGLSWLNSSLAAVLRSEALLLKRTRLNFPAGLSVICIGQKSTDNN
jgi:SAM-dependent methyltransferase